MSEGKEKGWLWKQGGKVKNWKHRYFILHFTYLEYFETDKVFNLHIRTHLLVSYEKII